MYPGTDGKQQRTEHEKNSPKQFHGDHGLPAFAEATARQTQTERISLKRKTEQGKFESNGRGFELIRRQNIS
jgi:hypothetical protein